jgi:hypothetical protein
LTIAGFWPFPRTFFAETFDSGLHAQTDETVVRPLLSRYSHVHHPRSHRHPVARPASFRSTARRAKCTNAGAALVISPALLTKYLDAAKEIASD